MLAPWPSSLGIATGGRVAHQRRQQRSEGRLRRQRNGAFLGASGAGPQPPAVASGMCGRSVALNGMPWRYAVGTD
jgi:hypothetical protein